MPIPRSVEQFLSGQHVPYSVIAHRPAYTAQQEAAVAHVPGHQWAKTVACLADDRPILAVVPAPSFVDLGQTKVGRTSAVKQVVGNAPVRLESFCVTSQGIE